MRIFHIITHFDLGGAERVAANIANSSTNSMEYHLVEVVKGDGKFSRAFRDELHKAHIHCHRSPIKNNKLGIILFPFWFIWLSLKWKPNIIHTHTEVPDLSIYLWNKLFGWVLPSGQYVRTIHNTKLWSQWEAIGSKVEKFFIGKRANIAISLSVQDCYNKVYGERPPIIFNGLAPVEQFPFEHLKKDKVNILFAGRLESQKGIDTLIEVIKALKSSQSFHFYVVGGGSYAEKVQQAIGNQDNISLYDKIFGLNHYVGSFDYLFMPSIHEGLALMSIEASLAHTPTIINKCPGLEETLPDDWPLKVEGNNVDDFVQIILSLEHNPLRSEWAETAYKFAEKHFSMEKMQKEYEKVYGLLVSRQCH